MSPTVSCHLRIARPVHDLGRTTVMYTRGLGLVQVGHFTDHDGIDGVMLGWEDAGYHLEFTCSRHHPVSPSPTPDDLLVFYLPVADEWTSQCAAMLAAGFREVTSLNPYWNVHGRTCEDPDGYRVVLQHAAWANRRDD